MNILFVSPYLPHPLSGHGGGVYLYDMLRRLSKDHTLSLICFADEKEMKLAPGLSALPIKVQLIPRMKRTNKSISQVIALVLVRSLQLLRSIVLWQPYYVSKFRHRKMTRAISETTTKQRFDIVQIEYAQMGQYVTDVKQGKTIVHLIDVTFRPAYRYYKGAKSIIAKAALFVEWCRWMYYEPRMVRKFDGVTTLTEPDQMLLQRLTGLHSVEILPPGVEIPKKIITITERDPHSLLFIGSLSHIANDDAAVWLCSEIFPKILEDFPRATLSIIGKNPSAALLAIAEQTKKIKVLGFVENLSDYLLRSAVFIAPLRLGGGIKIKILDALIHCIPVVTTPVGIEGISGLNSSSVRIARKASDLAMNAVELLNDPAKAKTVGRMGQEAAIRHHSWESILKKTDAYYQRIVESSP